MLWLYFRFIFLVSLNLRVFTYCELLKYGVIKKSLCTWWRTVIVRRTETFWSPCILKHLDENFTHFGMWLRAGFIYEYKKKVKWSRYRPGVAQRVGRGTALLFHDRGTRRGWVVSSTPQLHFTPGKYPVHILQEARWAPRSGLEGRKNLVATGIRSRTVQPVVSCYTDWATRPTIYEYDHGKTTSYTMWPLIFFVNIVTEICFVHESGHGIFFLQQCDRRQFLLQNVAKKYLFFICGLYSFPHECDHCFSSWMWPRTVWRMWPRAIFFFH